MTRNGTEKRDTNAKKERGRHRRADYLRKGKRHQALKGKAVRGSSAVQSRSSIHKQMALKKPFRGEWLIKREKGALRQKGEPEGMAGPGDD